MRRGERRRGSGEKIKRGRRGLSFLDYKQYGKESNEDLRGDPYPRAEERTRAPHFLKK